MLHIAKKLQQKNIEPTLCVSDFKAQIKAKSMGFANTISMDVLRNMANVMSEGNVLVYESNEDAGLIKQDLEQYCSLVIKIDESYFPLVGDCATNSEAKGGSVFFGDDDYSEEFLNMVQSSDSKYDTSLILGEYFFLNNDKILKQYFADVYESDEYEYGLNDCACLLSANVQCAIEAIAMGKDVMFFERDDKLITQSTKDILNKYGVLFAKTSNKQNGNYFKNLISEFAGFAKAQDKPNIKHSKTLQQDATKNMTSIISKITAHIEQNTN